MILQQFLDITPLRRRNQKMKWKKVKENKTPYWVCEHGYKHPDLDYIYWKTKEKDKQLRVELMAHDCDECCYSLDFPGNPQRTMSIHTDYYLFQIYVLRIPFLYVIRKKE